MIFIQPTSKKLKELFSNKKEIYSRLKQIKESTKINKKISEIIW